MNDYDQYVHETEAEYNQEMCFTFSVHLELKDRPDGNSEDYKIGNHVHDKIDIEDPVVKDCEHAARIFVKALMGTHTKVSIQ